MDERPQIRVLVARPLSEAGTFSRSQIVPLYAVPVYLKAGYVAVGPDPEDLAAFIEWENEQHRLQNRPRWWQS